MDYLLAACNQSRSCQAAELCPCVAGRPDEVAVELDSRLLAARDCSDDWYRRCRQRVQFILLTCAYDRVGPMDEPSSSAGL